MGGNQSGAPWQEEFLAGGGEMGERMRAFDWPSHSIGAVSGWPQSLRSALSICLNSSFPIALYWGAELRLLYNDEWSPILGGKHPWALGRTARETWPEIWNIIEPLFAQVMTTGEATRSRDQLLPMNRHGFTEECYFDYTFSPIRGESGKVEGVFNAVLETTTRVIGERRLKTLRELAAQTIGEATSAEEACLTATKFLGANPYDLPFTRIFLLDGDRRATLCGGTGIEDNELLSRPSFENPESAEPWPFQAVALAGKPVIVDELSTKFGPLVGKAWPEQLNQAVVLPLASQGHSELAGYVVAGLSPRLALTDEYRTFLELLAGHIAASIATARSHEEEIKRAEALAELDRAKTAFFSNVSHEFRTPLTLMLGPVEELLAQSHAVLPPAAAGQLEVVNRNGLRLLRLVNSLLDFSRIEAGRVRATFQQTNLAIFTTDLASSFRSACERAGLRLIVQCPALDEPVYVDREMWEKIVLNLVSNAFKFTLDGEIAVSLQRSGNTVELQVRDTGTGIPSEEIHKLFERFHRIENARGRTHEGSGIGLALVQELVRLHHGTVTVESTLGQGTTFIVAVPMGHGHLPPDQIGQARRALSSSTGVMPYVEEALRWLPNSREESTPEALPLHGSPHSSSNGDLDNNQPRVLVADDNADLREYIARLLSEQFQVELVPDGEAALASVRRQAPDLVLTDIMMPRLDGFGLLKELRADPQTRHLPIILLSARAGEESRVEGMETGADDYLIKPFSARELLARVTAHIQIAKLRRESERAVRESDERLRVTFASIGDAVLTTDTQCRVTNMNAVAESLTRWTASDAIGQPLEAVFRIVNETTRLPVENPATKALRDGVVVGLANHTVLIAKDGSERPIDDSAAPIRAKDGELLGSVLVFRDVTERRATEKALQDSELRYRLIGHAANDAIWDWDLVSNNVVWNEGVHRVFGYREHEIGASADWWIENIHPDDRERISESIHQAIDGGAEFWRNEYRYRRADGSHALVFDRGQIVRRDNTPVRMVGSMLDQTERKRTELELREVAAALSEASRRKDEFLATLAHELRNPLAPLRNALQIMKLSNEPEAHDVARNMMERQLAQMVRLVDDLMDVSRITRGKVDLRKERVPLSVVIDSAVETSRPLLQQMRHELSISLPRQPIVVDADLTRLAQVFANLLNNAAKYSEQGGQISLTVERPNGEVVVTIRDTGIGIAADQLPRIFEMFTQVDRSLERSQGGLGIGLTLVSRLVEMHGGSVEAKSAGLGQGSEFVVRLPVVPDESKAGDSGADDRATPKSSLRILVVDDNRDGANSLAMMLKCIGNDTRTAYDGEDGVKVAEAYRPDVILFDIGLPKLNGYEACRLIRQQVWGKPIVLIAVTGWGQDEDRRRSQESGFDHHLVKPVDPRALMRLLASLHLPDQA